MTHSDPRIAVILAAAGSARRMGQDKLLYSLRGKTVVRRSAEAFADALGREARLIVAVSPHNEIKIAEQLQGLGATFVRGGATRAESIQNALAQLDGEEVVLVHDAARPLVGKSVILRAVEYALAYGAAVPAVPVKDTVRIGRDGFGVDTPDRSTLYAVQTPQAFRAEVLCAAYEGADLSATDDAALVEQAGGKVFLFEGESTNIKLTTPEDLLAAKVYLGGGDEMRVGTGYDVHAFAEGRKLILGGVDVPHTHGLAGHSDADVLIHAVMDALLGAASLGDIGKHFPDSDGAYKDIDSRKLLARVAELLAEHGYRVVNVDATVIAQAPKLAPHIEKMRENIAQTLGVALSRISVKATTTEGLGFEGRREGIAVQATALISEM